VDLVGPKQLVPRRDAPSRATISGVIAVPLKGRLLIASPALADTNFDHTIVLVVEHSDEGALGLVLNRPSVAAVADALPGWAPVAADPAVVFVGGPVSPDAAIGLALAAEADRGDLPDGWAPILSGLGTVDLARDPGEVLRGVQVRVFAGYAGWTGGQLENELRAGGWFVVDADVDDALTTEPELLWRTVLRRQPGALAWLANFPLDPATN
jgi:putative transcriptional regulator